MTYKVRVSTHNLVIEKGDIQVYQPINPFTEV